MKIHFATVEDCDQAEGTVIVIDVLRAFTTAAVAFAQGASEILLASTVEEALDLKSRYSGSLVMGEVGTMPIPEFDLSNSSEEVAELDLAGTRLIHRTSNGTQGAYRAKNAQFLFAASFPTATATSAQVLLKQPESVTFVITGIAPDREGDEDRSCADFIAEKLLGRDPDPAPYIERAYESACGKWFTDDAKPQYPIADLKLATDVDRFDFAMPIIRESGQLVMRPTRLRPSDQATAE
jgi:2-phosphosulfolactate phosphatase